MNNKSDNGGAEIIMPIRSMYTLYDMNLLSSAQAIYCALCTDSDVAKPSSLLFLARLVLF